MNVIGFSKNIKRGLNGKNDFIDYAYIDNYESETNPKPYRPLKKHKTNRKTFSREHKYFSGSSEVNG